MEGWTLSAALERVRADFPAALEAAAAAGVAWWLAHDLLGHPQPFFAPIAAAVALGAVQIQRARRSVQMIVGVMLGIGIAELLHPLLGNGALPIAAVVLVTLLAAVAVSASLAGGGMMFVNQAVAAAVLVVALHKAGAGGERAVDALVGGGVALVFGVGLFPSDPLKLLWQAEHDLLSALAQVIERERSPATAGMDPAMEWALRTSQLVHARLGELALARSTARVSVRIAPRRMLMRAQIEAEERRVSRLNLLASGVLGLMATVEEFEHRAAVPSAACGAEVGELGDALGALLRERRPWGGETVAQVRGRLSELTGRALPDGSAQDAILATSVRRVAGELLGVLPG